MRDAARPREPDERAQLEQVVDLTNRSAGPPTRIVVNRRERLVARRLDADAALDVRPDRRTRRTARPAMADVTPAAPRRRRSIVAGVGQRPALGEREHELRDGVGGARAGRAPGRPRASRACAGRVVEDAPPPEQRRGVELLVVDEPRRPGLDERARVRHAGGPRRAGTGRRPSAGRARSASASVDEPARPTTRSAAASASVMSSRRNGYGGSARARPPAGRSRAASARRVAVSPVTWMTCTRSTSSRQRLGDRAR